MTIPSSLFQDWSCSCANVFAYVVPWNGIQNKCLKQDLFVSPFKNCDQLFVIIQKNTNLMRLSVT